MSAKIPKFPGFTAHSDQVFSRPGEALQDGQAIPPQHKHDPTTVLVYGWGDGLPKHVTKYADGFRALYPYATQVVVLSPISKAMFTSLDQRTEHMLPVLNLVFPPNQQDLHQDSQARVLVHTMSNTGAVNYAATLNAYREVHNRPMPHHLLIMDSTPGSTDLSRGNLSRWSRAMALGTAAWFPWPFVITQMVWGLVLLLYTAYLCIIGRQTAGAWSVRAVNQKDFESTGARRLYLYSKEDDLILWEDIEEHAAETRQLGWGVDAEVFEGSGHVGHMRMHPGQYWGAVARSWEEAMR
ncbi:hypothetical protein E4U17_001424 [Claviceps sp. LM77 group G4]|nr:hypothetical protein E4U17_001424 [Claviceps sp. LM77 group G4]KAG6080288.1 hypothetical protein E4U33_007710 [Claviceps sp. LM78 group G4]KAG6085022.1 hypothetical protein E4U16_000075 [Claviceps sp. LM84 group G4]